MSAENNTVTFADLGLAPNISATVTSLGYTMPTPIQAQAIPALLAGKDLLGQAQTGTGKTAAFALPLLSNLDMYDRATQVLVMVPTRELAMQVADAFKEYGSGIDGLRVLAIYGGQSMVAQLQSLKRGAHIVVGTPGRVMDHIRRKTLKLNDLRAAVLDEADEMLKMGFIDDIQWILDCTPAEKQVALFSATMPAPIKAVAQKHLKNQTEVRIHNKTRTVDTIDQKYWFVEGLHKLDALSRLLEVESVDAAIVFVRTKTATLEIAEKLEARGFNCAALNGDVSQPLRERVVSRLKDGSLQIVIATDVAARGLDVDKISHVINYDIPNDSESYVHRIGRTGRAGRTGTAILFVSPREQKMLRIIEKATRQPITELTLPTAQELTEKRIQAFKAKVVRSISKPDMSFYTRIVQEVMQENDLSADAVAAALCMIAQKEKPLQVKDDRVAKSKRNSREDSGAQHRMRNGDRERTGSRRPRNGHNEPGMVTYRIEVGRNHGANPGCIVAAIAENAGIEGRHIGKIKLFDKHSMVDLPDGMPRNIFKQLQRAYVNNRPMKICMHSSM